MPWPPRSFAHARPMPLVAPVTTATCLPFSDMSYPSDQGIGLTSRRPQDERRVEAAVAPGEYQRRAQLRLLGLIQNERELAAGREARDVDRRGDHLIAQRQQCSG